MYWDGLYSQNPPIHDLTDHNINELWLIQVNPSTCARVPTETHEIMNRRHELAGNLSMEQELKLIELINRLIARGKLQGPQVSSDSCLTPALLIGTWTTARSSIAGRRSWTN